MRCWQSLQQCPGREAGMGTGLTGSLCARTPAWHPPAAQKPLLSSSTTGAVRGKGEQCSHLGKSHPSSTFRWKLQPVLFKTLCLGSHLGICATQCPCGGKYYIPSLPCYFWMLKEQRANVLLSSAQLGQEESVRDGSAAHPHTPSSCGTADFWQWLMTCTKPLLPGSKWVFLHELPITRQASRVFRVGSLSSGTAFPG